MKNNIKKIFINSTHPILKCSLLALLLSLFLEIFVFNFRTFESLFWQNTDLLSLGYIYSENIHSMRGSIRIPFPEEGICNIYTDEMTGTVNNIHISARYLDAEGKIVESFPVVDMEIYSRDEGNELYYTLGTIGVSENFQRGNYYKVHLYGDLKSFKFTVKNPDASKVSYLEITELKVNDKVPFYFSFFRLFLCFCLISFVMLFWPTSQFWRISFGDISKKAKLCVSIICMLFLIIFCSFFANSNPVWRSSKRTHIMYYDITESLLEGHVYLKEEPAQSIQNMENPYDSNLRKQVLENSGERYLLDRAYYNGKYYVYFGILPVLVLFLPWYVIFGTHLSVTIAVTIIGIFYICGIVFLVNAIYKRWFNNASFASYSLWIVMMVMGSGMFYTFRYPMFYGLPIITAATCTVWGLYFWITAQKENSEWKEYRIALGAFLIALSAACRPQFLIVGFSFFILFGHELFSNFFTKKNLTMLVKVAIPVIFVAGLVMYYNYIRFGNIMDFGANYNLTGNDMTHRGWNWDRIPTGIFYYLLQPCILFANYPFIIDATKVGKRLSGYLGITTFEQIYGGLFSTRPILFLSIFITTAKRSIKTLPSKIWKLMLFFTVSAFIIIVADTEMAGIIDRYQMDFGWMLCLASLLGMAVLEIELHDYILNIFMRAFLAGSVLWSFVYEFIIWLNRTGAVEMELSSLNNFLNGILLFWH